MKSSVLGLLAAAILLPALARADEPPIIAKARAYLGSEAALDHLRTLHFVGTISREGDSGNKVEIFFEKPWRERIVVRSPGRAIETALDDFDGWQRSTDEASGRLPRFVLLGADITQNLRADTWENLNFYRGIEAAGGRMEDDGPATADGVACEKVAFIHSPSIIYYRFFDRATGRLVFTQTAAGVKIRERGEIIAGGIRFPQTILTEQDSDAGKSQVTTYTFERIAVNELLPDSLFTVPLSTGSP